MSELEQKKWKVRTADQSRELSFLPVFEITKKVEGESGSNLTDKDVECRYVDLELNDDKGNKMSMRMNFLDLYMFVYFIANEELRQQLQLRYERQTTQIPYEVTFKLDEQEKARGMAKRLITLSVDEITMAIARAGANELIGKGSKHKSIETYMHDKKNRKAQIITS